MGKAKPVGAAQQGLQSGSPGLGLTVCRLPLSRLYFSSKSHRGSDLKLAAFSLWLLGMVGLGEGAGGAARVGFFLAWTAAVVLALDPVVTLGLLIALGVVVTLRLVVALSLIDGLGLGLVVALGLVLVGAAPVVVNFSSLIPGLSLWARVATLLWGFTVLAEVSFPFWASLPPAVFLSSLCSASASVLVEARSLS